MTTDPRRFAEARWAELVAGRSLEPEQIAETTEAMLRAAVHPRCSRADAVDLLYRAHRLDPGDARLAYHLGRLALEDGKLPEADAWLTTAHAAAPHSHRITTHLLVTLRRLESAQPAGNAETRAAHRSRIRELSTAVRADGLRGSDWPGLYDAEFQALLPLAVTDSARTELREILTALRDLADRPGGVRAFAVAAIGWLIRGYPPDDVRDLADGLPAGDHHASYLLTLVRELFAMPEEKLPGRLARALTAGELPETVVALIHHRRLLDRVRPFPELGAYRAAERYETTDEEEAARHVQALDAAIATLRARPAPLGSGRRGAAAEPTPAEDAVARLHELEAARTTFTEDRAALSDFITGPLKAAARTEEPARVAADRALMFRTLDLMIEAVTEAHARATSLLGDVGHLGTADLGDDFNSRADTVRTKLGELMQPGKTLRQLRQIKVAANAGTDAAPSPEAEAVAARCGDPGEAAPEEPLPSPTDVEAARQRAYDAVAEIFGEAERSLEPYPESEARRHLADLIVGRLAENQYRLSRSSDARRTWHRLLADNGPGTAAYRNLAVASVSDGDGHHATEMLRRYLSAATAPERERVHAVLAAAYLPPGLRGDSDAGPAESIRFLASERAIRAAVVHMRLRRDSATTEDGRREAVKQVILLKQRVSQALFGPGRWALSITAIDLLTNLRLLEELPLDADDGLTYRAALEVGIDDPAGRLAALNEMRDRAVSFAIQRILGDAARQEGAVRYGTLLKAWVDSDLPLEESFRLDNVRSLYDTRTTAAVTAAQDKEVTPDVISAQQTLHKWLQLLPAATGPACDLALLNDLTGDTEGAWRVLARAVVTGVHPMGLRRALDGAIRAGWKLKRHKGLTTLVRRALVRLPDDEKVWEMAEWVHLSVAADMWLNGHRKPTVRSDYQRWYEENVSRQGPRFREAGAELLQKLRDQRL